MPDTGQGLPEAAKPLVIRVGADKEQLNLLVIEQASMLRDCDTNSLYGGFATRRSEETKNDITPSRRIEAE